MDELNAPLGTERDQKNTDSLFSAGKPLAKLLAGIIFLSIGAVYFWYNLSGTKVTPKPSSVEIAISDNVGKPRIKPGELRNSSPQADKTLTRSDPSKPARLDELKPSGRLEEPKITIINPSRSGPLKLSYLPDQTLVEKSAFGLLPRKSRTGKRPLDAYARPVYGAGSARIAIVVGGMGLSQSGSKSAIEKLPGVITFAFAPYGNSLMRWMKKARKDGHELLMQVPMEPIGYPQINPGKRTLVTGVAPGINLENLEWSMARLTNYVGIMNYLGAKLQADEASMGPILKEINDRGLLYLDDGSTFSSKTPAIAKALGLPMLTGNIVIDDERSAKAIKSKLLLLEKRARRYGSAIGVGSAFPVTVRQIAQWVEQAEKRGIDIVPVSALVQ